MNLLHKKACIQSYNIIASERSTFTEEMPYGQQGRIRRQDCDSTASTDAVYEIKNNAFVDIDDLLMAINKFLSVKLNTFYK